MTFQNVADKGCVVLQGCGAGLGKHHRFEPSWFASGARSCRHSKSTYQEHRCTDMLARPPGNLLHAWNDEASSSES